MKSKNIYWTEILKKYFGMNELTFDSFIKGIQNNNDIETGKVWVELSDYSREEQKRILANFFDKFTDKTNDGFVKEDNINKILNALEINKKNSGFSKKIIEFINAMSISDSDKIKIIKIVNDEPTREYLIETLSTDEEKLKEIHNVKYDYSKEKIIKTLSTDMAKLKAIETMQDEYLRAKMIATLSSEKLKLKAIETIQSEYSKAEIIRTLSHKKKLREMEKIKDESARAYIIESFLSDDVKVKEMKTIQSEFLKEDIIKTLSSDKSKIKVMQTIQNKHTKLWIIKILSSDNAKIYAISNLFRISLFEDFENNKKIKLPPYMTIGCEIESEGVNSEALINLTLLGWKGMTDGSLINGVEMVSPIMHSNVEDIQSIYKICDLIKKIKNSTSDRCGGHIHIGADYLKDKQAYANLLSIYGNTEKLLYIIANDPKDVTSRTTRYDNPISKKVQDAIESGSINLETDQNVNEFIRNLESIQICRYSSLNFWSYDEHRTIEFRLPNGTINPDAWIENINLCGGIIKAAEDISEIYKKSVEERNEAEKRKLELFERLQSKGLNDKEKLEILLELVIDEEDRYIYRNRYNKNSKLLNREQKKEFKKGMASRPIKVKKINKKIIKEIVMKGD